jgi:hypothetical protein
MKNGLVVGAIAGLIAGISGVILGGGVGSTLGFIPTSPIPVMEWTAYWIIITLIFGIIFGFIYEKLYDSIPGKGISKGLLTGFTIWLIKDVATAAYLGAERANVSIIAILWVGFCIWIVYGLVIGKLYKK